jgi:hypothetical protein
MAPQLSKMSQMGREPAFFPMRDLNQDVPHEDDSILDSDLLVHGIDPEEGILLGQRPSLKISDLRVEPLRDRAP